MEGCWHNMRRVKKKPVVYVCILIVILLVTLLISYVTGVSTSNTWLGLLFANSFFGTITIMLFDLARSIKYTRPFTRYAVYFFPYLLLVGIILSNIIFIIEGFNY